MSVGPDADHAVLAQRIAREEQQRRALEDFAGYRGRPAEGREAVSAMEGDGPDALERALGGLTPGCAPWRGPRVRAHVRLRALPGMWPGRARASAPGRS
ncbi:hypothetical protein [Streptomyces avermitilis]|uniref:hypothetical protein n=1 Tax=Streptomyces avermitilis TaxID=33903 RepID=UPI0033E09B89